MEQGRAFASHLPPYSLVLGAAVAAALLVVSREPLRDADLYWHVLAGQEMVEHRSVAMAADDWSLLAETGTWISTQWLSEILFAGLKASFGWAGLAGYTLATTAVALFLLARSTLHDRPAATTALPFLLATFSIALAAGARPQQFTLIGAAALGGVLDRGLAKRQLPRWFLLLPLVLLWANSHGGWILAPFVLTLLTVWGGVSDRAMTPFVRRAASLALLCLLAGAISPNGFRNVSAVFRFAASTRAIAEWQRVDLLSAGGAILLAMAVLAIGGWLGADRHVPTGVVLLAILAFSWTAWRNLPPGMLLLSPVVANLLTVSFPVFGVRSEPAWSARASAAAAALGLVFAGLVASLNASPSDSGVPVALVARVAGLAANPRVLNDYNISGALLLYGGPSVKVAIDGRADLYGANYISRYLDLLARRGDNSGLLDELKPNMALLRNRAPLADYLIQQREWVVIGAELGYVLLVDPGLVQDR